MPSEFERQCHALKWIQINEENPEMIFLNYQNYSLEGLANLKGMQRFQNECRLEKIIKSILLNWQCYSV